MAFTLSKLAGQLLMPLPLGLRLAVLLWWPVSPGELRFVLLILGMLAALSTPAAGGWLRRQVKRRGGGGVHGFCADPEELSEADAMSQLCCGKASTVLFTGRTRPGTALSPAGSGSQYVEALADTTLSVPELLRMLLRR
jgi:hypothetical protein